MILVIDNYDSFTYNIVQYIGEVRNDLEVFRNDQITLDQIEEKNPDHIVISPGPCTPKEAGISTDVARTFGSKIPTLGVCLGHQCVGEAFGGKVVLADRLMHGKTSMIHHNEDKLYREVPSPFEATRYHSLVVEKESLPDCFELTAWTDQDEVMGIRHKELPIWGVQFHPESILTREGKQIVHNFLKF